jgi:NAD(P)-dependent dehydrogenase (short-subunit alcohol dehydrogenase family)
MREHFMADFSQKTVIVTGGARGIGRSIVAYLWQRQANVVIADCDHEAGKGLVEDLKAYDKLRFIPTDVSSEDAVSACIDQAVKAFGTVDGLVNNAGIANPGNTPITEMKLEEWQRMLQTNLTGAFLMVKHTAPYLARRKGAIVNMSSTRALQSEPHTEAYAASKGGLVALTHALAISFSNRIRVNVILPGWIDVRSLRKNAEKPLPQLSQEDHLQHPAGRVGVPDDIAALTAYLLGDEAGFITGQSFVVDGGMTKKMIYVE